MKVHIHNLDGADEAQCLKVADLSEGQKAEISFDPADVRVPWTIVVAPDERDAAGETVIITLATTEQVRRLKLGAAPEAPETLYEGAPGEKFVEIPEAGKQ